MAGIDVNRGAKRAREARAALGLDDRAPLECLLSVVEERAKLPVVVAALPEGIAGLCFREGGGTVLWVNGTQWRPRQRFTLAHELGHAWCRHDGALEVDTVDTLSGRTTNPYEIQANAFAAEFLVPRACMEEVIDGEPTLDEVAVVSAHTGVSAWVVVYRLKQLRLASDKRIAQLERELDDNLHRDAFDRCGCTWPDDRIEGIRHLPYLSPALEDTQLGAAIRDRAAATGDVAAAVGRVLL